ncbi:MAG: GtrA family protein, partial [Methylotetracoccus sp.]|nr:GtrA family protein [Methylotetracoccus sp.]
MSKRKAEILDELGRLVRFAIVGVVATLVHLSVAFALAMWLNWPNQAANLAGFASALMPSFLGHHCWTFRSDLRYGIAAPRFFLVAAMGYVASAMM